MVGPQRLAVDLHRDLVLEVDLDLAGAPAHDGRPVLVMAVVEACQGHDRPGAARGAAPDALGDGPVDAAPGRVEEAAAIALADVDGPGDRLGREPAGQVSAAASARVAEAPREGVGR